MKFLGSIVIFHSLLKSNYMGKNAWIIKGHWPLAKTSGLWNSKLIWIIIFVLYNNTKKECLQLFAECRSCSDRPKDCEISWDLLQINITKKNTMAEMILKLYIKSGRKTAKKIVGSISISSITLKTPQKILRCFLVFTISSPFSS